MGNKVESSICSSQIIRGGVPVDMDTVLTKKEGIELFPLINNERLWEIGIG